MNSLVSVIIPVKDRPDELKRAILSVLNQDYVSLEIIIIENNSENPNLVYDVANLFSLKNIFIYSLSPCDNTNVARNFGVMKSSGTYVAFLDSDDEWLPDHLAKSISTLVNEQSDFVYGGAIIDNGFNKRPIIARRINKKEGAVNYLVGFRRGYAQSSSFVLKSSVFLNFGWDNELKRTQDLDFFIRASECLNLSCTDKVTTVIHWNKNDVRDVDIPSMVNFSRKYKDRMTYLSFIRYKMICFRNAKNLNDFFTILLG